LRSGPAAADEVQIDAKGNGISQGTLANAKQRLGVIATKRQGRWGEWEWSLPGETKADHAPNAIALPERLLN
jgi:hypothetical protein